MTFKNTLALGKAIEAFLGAERRGGKADLTVVNYRADLAALSRSMGERACVSQLEEAALEHLQDLRVARRSWNRHLSTLRRFCEFMVERGALARNPLGGIQRVRVTTVSPAAPASAQVDSVIDAASRPRDVALLVLLRDCGLRISEALALRVSDVNLEVARIAVNSSNPRQVWLTPAAQALLQRYLQQRVARPSEPLFTSHGVRALSYAGAHRLFRRYAGATGLTMQRLRASAAVSAFDRGASLTQVQAMLGHQHAASTARYQADADQQAARPAGSPAVTRKKSHNKHVQHSRKAKKPLN